MQKQSFMRADEVAQELGISKSHAYKVIHGLNKELQEKGYLTISGRVNREFFRDILRVGYKCSGCTVTKVCRFPSQG